MQDILGQEEPGFGRWTEEEREDLFTTYAKEIQEKAKLRAENANGTPMQLAKLSGSPGILFEECFGDLKDRDLMKGQSLTRAKLLDAEWRNGIRALNGEDMQGVVGRFPDKNGKFHWDECCDGREDDTKDRHLMHR